MKKDLSALREEYSGKPLDTNNVSEDPLIQFGLWFDEALQAGIPEVNAMNMATVSKNGLPKSRIVLLKGVEDRGFTFYTNYQSSKGKELDNNPAVALNFFWASLARQIRIEGMVERTSKEESEKYFQSRPKSSQIGAWASPQSLAIESREILEERKIKLEEAYKEKDVLPKPEQWGGYRVTPYLIEFWQGRRSRLHDRIVYTLQDKQWKITRLAP